MKLFEEIPSEQRRRALFSESDYESFTITNSSEIAETRRLLNEWFSRYPSIEQQELLSRFRKGDFKSAFFELYLHELLTRLGCSVDIHPILKNTKRVDYLVTDPQNNQFYLEAVTTSDPDASSESHQINQLIDEINKLKSPDFFLSMEIRGKIEVQPSGKKIRSFLEKQLSTINADDTIKRTDKEGMEALPTWQYPIKNGRILFQPLPKQESARGKEDARLIGLFSDEMKRSVTSELIRKAVQKKAGRYGQMTLPYLIAVNVLDPIVDNTDIVEALFGKEVWHIGMDGSQSEITGWSRNPDGAIVRKSGYINTRVSGVLISNVFPSFPLSNKKLRLYHNPAAELKYDSILTKLPQAIPNKGELKLVDGVPPASILSDPN